MSTFRLPSSAFIARHCTNAYVMWSQVTQAGEGKSTFARCLAGQARWCGCSCVFDLAHMRCIHAGSHVSSHPNCRLFLHRSLPVRLSAALCQCACPPLFANAPVRRSLPGAPRGPSSCSFFSHVIGVHLLDPPPKGLASASEVRGPALASARSRDSHSSPGAAGCPSMRTCDERASDCNLQRPGAPDCMSVHVCARATSMMQASR